MQNTTETPTQDQRRATLRTTYADAQRKAWQSSQSFPSYADWLEAWLLKLATATQKLLDNQGELCGYIFSDKRPAVVPDEDVASEIGFTVIDILDEVDPK